jgi:hypothetical protein
MIFRLTHGTYFVYQKLLVMEKETWNQIKALLTYNVIQRKNFQN